VSTSEYIILKVEDFNEYGHGGDRPESVYIPPPKEFELPYIYENEDYSVGVTVTYSINECYPTHEPIDVDPSSTILICLGLIVLLVIMIFILIFNKFLNRIARNATDNTIQ
jgi:hypothetical protein